MTAKNIAASIRAKLLNKSRKEKTDFNLALTRYMIERLLYRISISQYADQFLLKGALLFDLWFDIPSRPTRDADFLGLVSTDIPQLEGIFKDLCGIDCEDGVVFQPDTVRANEIRKEANYMGVRIIFAGTLDTARSAIQVDIGFGDAVTPEPEVARYPATFPELGTPTLKAYPRYTVVAEKFEALVSLGMANSRMKDYFDLWILARHGNLDNDIFQDAICSTFSRRKTPLPENVPLGLSDTFALDQQKQIQWKAFLNKNGLTAVPLDDLVRELASFIMPCCPASH